MKVMVLVGSYPPQQCGVGDFSYKLVNNFNDASTEIVVLANIDWSVKNIIAIVKEINFNRPDIIHIQYPSLGFGFSLVPQILSIIYPTIVTIHEVSQSHWIRKLSLMPFSFRSKLIFTNPFEFAYYKKLYPWVRKKSKIIPIGSNIELEQQIGLEDKNVVNIIYFGQIRPEKGLEEIANLSNMISEHKINYKIIIMGQLLTQFNDYYNKIFPLFDHSVIEWKLNLAEKDVSAVLSENLICYLPFPDGASARRGSLFAALQNNMLVFSTKGLQTTLNIEQSIVIVNTATEMLNILSSTDKEVYINIYKSKKTDIEAFNKSVDWSEIASQHLQLYSKISIN
ncbi:hypothetical protein [Mucilaginibacter terrae]|uniref:Glycosyltransferase involved in cell wall biosynthesis n=1 Tax=Mucilaginibacter terrae TaxID=1955052 RepID=A0ABU3GPS5_9SPHI|nr:hypothetical protein [Mucilaginibacter terrae]MDT3401761.1 glycosyltransferase involved in cell wall biosynthesis [Mucilaginibacter terrae]